MNTINSRMMLIYGLVIYVIIILPTTTIPILAQTSVPRCTVVVRALNVRSGPSTRYSPPIFVLSRGTTIIPLSRNQNSNWIRMQVEETSEQGWISASTQYVSCDIVLSSLPIDSASPILTRETASSTPVPRSQPGLVTGFEAWRNWTRGDEAWGTFIQSQEQVYAGRFSGKFIYDFPAVPNNYIIYRRRISIVGQPHALQIWVYGDGSGNFLNTWVRDATGQLWQFTFGQINHTGWQQMTAPLNVRLGWPNQPIGGNSNATDVVYPLQFYGLVVDGWREDIALKGTIFVDDLSAVNTAASSSSQAVTSSPTMAPIVTVPAVTPDISFRVDDSTIDASQCTSLHWAVTNVQAVYLDGEGVVGHSSRMVCPSRTRTYRLRVVTASGSQVYEVTIKVRPPIITVPAITATPTPSRTPRGG